MIMSPFRCDNTLKVNNIKVKPSFDSEPDVAVTVKKSDLFALWIFALIWIDAHYTAKSSFCHRIKEHLVEVACLKM